MGLLSVLVFGREKIVGAVGMWESRSNFQFESVSLDAYSGKIRPRVAHVRPSGRNRIRRQVVYVWVKFFGLWLREWRRTWIRVRWLLLGLLECAHLALFPTTVTVADPLTTFLRLPRLSRIVMARPNVTLFLSPAPSRS